MNKLSIGYHASHEQFSPSELLKWSVLAETEGFDAINSSDHFHPWSERQGQSGHSFSWLGAAMQATSVPFSLVCAPGQRYHPAIVAQSIATLSEMFPGRFTVALGSGEAINESITGDIWPEKKQRNERLQECYSVIKDLLNGSRVTHYGHTHTENARLYTLPQKQPLLIGAALSPETAEWMGSWTDGLITVSKPYEELKKIVTAFRENGGAGKPLYLKVQLSYASTDELALKGAYDQWRSNILPEHLLSDISDVDKFDSLSDTVSAEELRKKINISSDTDKHLEWIRQYIRLGFQYIILHNINRGQELFIKTFGEKVLKALK